QDHGADRLFVEVERQAQRAVLEFEELVDRRAGEARDARDSVADLEHPANLGDLDGGREALEILAQRGGDVRSTDGQLGHDSPTKPVLIGVNTTRLKTPYAVARVGAARCHRS